MLLTYLSRGALRLGALSALASPRALHTTASTCALRATASAKQGAAGDGIYASIPEPWRALLVEKDARLHDKNDLIKEKNERLVERDAAFARERALLLDKVAHSLEDADLAAGAVNARAKLEQAIKGIWDLPSRRASKAQTMTARSKALLDDGSAGVCPGLVAYLRVAAEDNDEPVEAVLKCARVVYELLSSRLRANSADGDSVLPDRLFDSLAGGRPLVVAYSAVLKFSGRNVAFATLRVGSKPVVLRVPCACDTPLEAVRASGVCTI